MIEGGQCRMGCAVWVWLREGQDKDWLQCAGWDWMRFTSGPGIQLRGKKMLAVQGAFDSEIEAAARQRYSRYVQRQRRRTFLSVQAAFTIPDSGKQPQLLTADQNFADSFRHHGASSFAVSAGEAFNNGLFVIRRTRGVASVTPDHFSVLVELHAS